MEAYMDFTIDQVNFAGLPEYVQQLKSEGTRYTTLTIWSWSLHSPFYAVLQIRHHSWSGHQQPAARGHISHVRPRIRHGCVDQRGGWRHWLRGRSLARCDLYQPRSRFIRLLNTVLVFRSCFLSGFHEECDNWVVDAGVRHFQGPTRLCCTLDCNHYFLKQ